MKLALGPNLYYWPLDIQQEFYAAIAKSAVDMSTSAKPCAHAAT